MPASRPRSSVGMGIDLACVVATAAPEGCSVRDVTGKYDYLIVVRERTRMPVQAARCFSSMCISHERPGDSIVM